MNPTLTPRAFNPVIRILFGMMIGTTLLWQSAVPTWAESVCARVKIEIHQELTLERQGFEAHMRITNGLSDITLEDVGVTVTFTDENNEPVIATSDPDHPDAKFFIRTDRMENIGAVDGTGSGTPGMGVSLWGESPLCVNPINVVRRWSKH